MLILRARCIKYMSQYVSSGAICIATWTTIFQPWFNRLTIYTAVHELLQYCGYSISISPCRLCTHCSWLMKCRAARVFNLPPTSDLGHGEAKFGIDMPPLIKRFYYAWQQREYRLCRATPGAVVASTGIYHNNSAMICLVRQSKASTFMLFL